MGRRAGSLLLVPALSLLSTACTARRAPGSGTGLEPARWGVYQATYTDPGTAPRHFRLWIYAEAPDRLHAEVLAPVGGPAVIVDAGQGRLAVTVPSERTAWVGEASAESLARIVGFPMGLRDLVGALLGADEPPGGGEVRVSRSPARDGGLPRALTLEASGRSLHLDLRRLRKLQGGGAGLGTGSPPGGIAVKPLEALSAEQGPALLPEP
jgi:hypothetical protein